MSFGLSKPHTVIGVTPKPKYILSDISKESTASNNDIQELYQYYTDLAVKLADKDIKKLEDLVECFDYFDPPTIEAYELHVIAYCISGFPKGIMPASYHRHKSF